MKMVFWLALTAIQIGVVARLCLAGEHVAAAVVSVAVALLFVGGALVLRAVNRVRSAWNDAYATWLQTTATWRKDANDKGGTHEPSK